MDKINDLGSGMFAGAISSVMVAGIFIPILVAFITIIMSHFTRRYLSKHWPIPNGK